MNGKVSPDVSHDESVKVNPECAFIIIEPMRGCREISVTFPDCINYDLTNEHEIPLPPSSSPSPSPPSPPDGPQRTSVFNPKLILAQHIQTTSIHSKKKKLAIYLY